MTLGELLEVYGRDEPFWINYPDDAGFYDAMLFASKEAYFFEVSRSYIDGCELPFWEDDEIDYITHGGDGILTIELKYKEA